MVTPHREQRVMSMPSAGGGSAAAGGDLAVRIDGGQSLSADAIALLGTVCDQAEDLGRTAVVRVVVSGAPNGSWTRDLDVALVNKWERALRRLERLAATTV